MSFNLERKVEVVTPALLSIYYIYNIDIQSTHNPPQSGRGDHYAFPTKENIKVKGWPPPIKVKKMATSHSIHRYILYSPAYVHSISPPSFSN